MARRCEWAGDERRQKAEHGGVGTPHSHGASGLAVGSGAGEVARWRERFPMAGMPLFAHVGRKKLTWPRLAVPLELITFCGYKTQKSLFKVLRRRTGLVFACFAPQNRQKREGSRGFVRMLRFCLFGWGFRVKLSHRRPELTKFPMPVAQHENKKNPTIRFPGAFALARRLGGSVARRRGGSPAHRPSGKDPGTGATPQCAIGPPSRAADLMAICPGGADANSAVSPT